MAEYIDATITVDPNELYDLAVEYLQSRIPGWEPADGNLDAWLIEALSQIGSQVAETAQGVPTEIFRRFGQDLVNLPPQDATAATGKTTWTMIDNAGYTIPEGTTIGFQADDGSTVAFQTIADVEVPEGSTTAEGVEVVAVEEGAFGSGFTGEAGLLDVLDYVQTVTLEAQTTGGSDGETDEEYLERLVDELRLQTPRPILPDDFATLARRVAGVERSVAIDGYNPADESLENERMIAVATVDADGNPNSSQVKSEVDALLQGMREVNFVVNVIDPTYTEIDVTYTAVAWPGWDAEAVQAAADAAVAEYLSPSSWGQPPTGQPDGWVNDTKVRYLEVAQVLNAVDGLRYVTDLKVEGATADVNLTGAAPLPKPGTITGTVEGG